ncbi:MAG: peptide chain release factor 1 [Phycisphaerae bacterium]|nr:peptide chain release factor 1 [Phycisphaerae bacterium]
MVAIPKDPPWMKRVEEMMHRADAIAEEMNKPEVASSGVLIVKLARERGQLERVVKPYREYRSATTQLEESVAILNDSSSDPELRELAQAEQETLEGKRETIIRQLEERLVTSNDANINSIIVEIRAGTGGDEAALFAGELLDMYTAMAARKGFKTELLSISSSDLGGIKEAVLNITGEEVYLNYRFEGGGHRVQRVPKTEAQGRIHTSAATVAILPEPEEVEVEINWEKDVAEHVSRAGGPGGQNVNKVSSAIKLEHLATGITVSMRDDKSQHKNRAKARRILLSRVYEHHMSQQRAQRETERRSMVGSGDRSDRIRTYNFPQNRCTDHRINKDVFDLNKILVEGNLDDFLAELADRELKLRLESL